MEELAARVVELLCMKGVTIGTVESATGGLIAHLITDVPGSSDAFIGSIISYSNQIKINIVGVNPKTIEKYGAVSSQVARQMAMGGRRILGVDICVADTGIAGPSGATVTKPVGLYYLGLSYAYGTYSRKYEFHGTRTENNTKVALAALEWVRERLEKI
jgi:PncC family amidohydrolase